MEATEGNPVIAEVKVHSPKYGDILGDRDPIEILRRYEYAGATGISYITADEFKGDKELLRKICSETDLPVLRKDFITEKEDIEITAEYGASAVLLITSLLGDDLPEFVDIALESNLEPLVEVHDEQEIELANETDTPLIGINNRDISRMEMDDGTVSRTEELAELVRDDVTLISESGIRDIADMRRALDLADAVLIGTAFMKSKNPGSTLKKFVDSKR
ncbi:MAG: indole-3-glycerol phosphate synthase TrpC [Candidatus Saliniplasma sp.]